MNSNRVAEKVALCLNDDADFTDTDVREDEILVRIDGEPYLIKVEQL